MEVDKTITTPTRMVLKGRRRARDTIPTVQQQITWFLDVQRKASGGKEDKLLVGGGPVNDAFKDALRRKRKPSGTSGTPDKKFKD